MRKKFYEDVVSIVTAACRSVQANNEKIAALDEQIADRRFTEDHKRTLCQQRDTLARLNDDTRLTAENAVAHRCAVFRSALEGEFDLDGSKVTADARLLDFPLSASELTSLALRNRSNPTMVKLILKHAESKNIDIGMKFRGNEDEISQLPGVAHAAEVAMRHAGSGDVFNRLFGEGSAIERMFNVATPAADVDPIALTDERVRNAAELIRRHPSMSVESIEKLVGEFEGQPAALVMLRSIATDAINGRAMAAIDALLDA